MAAVAELYVNDNRIDCPNRGNIDLDICLFCDNLLNVSLDNVHPFIRCTPPGYTSSGLMQSSRQRRTRKRTDAGVPKTQDKPPSRTELQTISAVIATSFLHPEWGLSRVASAVQEQGFVISRRKVAEIFKNNDMVYKEDRLRRLLAKIASGEMSADHHQTELLNKYDPCFRDRDLIGQYPGQNILQASILVPAKTVSAPVYVDIAIDTYSGYTCGLVTQNPSPSTQAVVLQHYVFPFASEFTIRPSYVFTPADPTYKSPQYGEYLNQLGVEQKFFQHTPAMVEQFRRELLQPWVKHIPPHQLIRRESLQSHFQTALEKFNSSCRLSGFPNLNSTPQARITAFRENNSQHKRFESM